ncbi:MAG: DNA-3-methyladenine glycosylase I [Candidatus Marinimicrobia bacterium]|nr:DNA-3-methyladenine glycosylase I [Candidatus Neomarinimicrobiota bacterium]
MKYNSTKARCDWPGDNPLMIAYHDNEWGVPVHDDRKLFEFIVLDSFQAGLSWAIVLNKREGFRDAFDNFQPEVIASYDEQKIQKLIQNPAIIRNKLKIRSTITNAHEFLDIQKEFGSFDKFIWQFTGGKTITNLWKTEAEIPTRSPESDAMSNELKKRGFKFVGTTICYAFMQAAGMVNDHLTGCFRYRKCGVD